jgi:hypothetical protein
LVFLRQHKVRFGPKGHKIVSISFDKEPSVMSKQVQTFFRRHFISLHGFEMTNSKSKMAENVIMLLQTTLAWLMTSLAPAQQNWWLHICQGVPSLNGMPLGIDRKHFDWSPANINRSNLEEFLQELHHKVPVYYFAKFEIAPQLLKFKFSVGSMFWPKLLATSAAQIGIKRSAVNLAKDQFQIEEPIAYVARNVSVE